MSTPTVPPVVPNYQANFQPPKKSHTTRKVVLICLGAVVVLIVLIASLAGGSKSTPKAAIASPAVTHSQAAPVRLSAAQLAAQKAAAARAAAAAKKAQVAASASAAAQAKAAAAAAKKAAAQASASAAAQAAAENTPISAARWGDVVRDPASYVGDVYTITGTVSEYNINSNTFATVENAALVATDANGNSFIVEADSSLLGNVQPGQTFTAKVSVVGVAQTQSTIGGGTGQAPDFDASTFTVSGS